MPRVARNAPGQVVYHVLNRANDQVRLFRKESDFQTFQQVLLAAHQRMPMRILGWCIMPDHWHLVLHPRRDGELSTFMRWITLTHAQRWKQAHDAVGDGHLYQSRYKSFPIEQDEHLLTVLRYIERNPLRAKRAAKAQDWRWGSAHVRQDRGHELHDLLAPGPVARPSGWLAIVNKPQPPEQEQKVLESITRSRPFGSDPWVRRIAKQLNLTHTLRPRGRPLGWRKNPETGGKTAQKTAQKTARKARRKTK